LQDNHYVKVQKTHVKAALDVGTGWLFDAEKGMRLLRKYGDGGTEPSQAVINRASLTDGKAEGSTKFFGWLVGSEGHYSR